MDSIKLERIREHYPGLTDEEIDKANQKIDYVLYDINTNEIMQYGGMDLLAFEQFQPPREGLEKMIVPLEDAWKLRGEFSDPSDGQHMFKVEPQNGVLKMKPEKQQMIEEVKLPNDIDIQELPVTPKSK